MSGDNNKFFLSNPWPIIMVVLLGAGVFVNKAPLQSARPGDSERAKFIPTTDQDVETRLWQDPIAAVELELNKLRASRQTAAEQDEITAGHGVRRVGDRIRILLDNKRNVTVLAVSIFGGSYAQAAETRRRWRFAVVSALGFQKYLSERADAIGYFHINLPNPPEKNLTLTVPYEWFKLDSTSNGKSSDVLVLWLNEDMITSAPQYYVNQLFLKLMPSSNCKAHMPCNEEPSLRFKLIGPAGSGMLVNLISDRVRLQQDTKNTYDHIPLFFEVFTPSATMSIDDMIQSKSLQQSMSEYSLANLSIVRTTGTDDGLAKLLTDELRLRRINDNYNYSDNDKLQLSDLNEVKEKDKSKQTMCEDGLVLVREWDTQYSEKLSEHIRKNFCPEATTDKLKSLREFTYLRGLDGALPDFDKQGNSAPRKDDSNKPKDLRAQLEDASPELAEGRNQFDYLRRLGDKIGQLDGIKAIGLIGSDVYDKLLILQALRSQLRDKIFFTTDLDARYLHADQKDWTRNLIIASTFDLTLRPELQGSTPPFRDTYQTGTYLATLMALENKPVEFWRDQTPKWLKPQLFEIGRTQAVYLPTPRNEEEKSKDQQTTKDRQTTDCSAEWTRCESIGPIRQSLPPIYKFWWIAAALVLGISLVLLTTRHIYEFAGVIAGNYRIFSCVIAVIIIGIIIVLVIYILLRQSLDAGKGEPFFWLEGVSVWPSIVLRVTGVVVTLALAFTFKIRNDRKAEKIARCFFGLGKTPAHWKLQRSRWRRLHEGPNLDLNAFGAEGKIKIDSSNIQIKISDVWQNYLRATGFWEAFPWIFTAFLLMFLLGAIPFIVLGPPSFPGRGGLVTRLNALSIAAFVPTLWFTIFWVAYETRVCMRFVKILSDRQGIKFDWSERCEKTEGDASPGPYRDAFLAFRLIARATQRIQGLIYLPFILILFMVVARSDLFDAMNFPLSLVFITAIALLYTLSTALMLRRGAEAARKNILQRMEDLLLNTTKDAKEKLPTSQEQIKLGMERIRSTREGAFAPFSEQPALQAFLLPFGGYGGLQLIESLLTSLKV